MVFTDINYEQLVKDCTHKERVILLNTLFKVMGSKMLAMVHGLAVDDRNKKWSDNTW